MREFVFGNDSQFELLSSELSDGRCHVYSGCLLPEGCVPDRARIGFEHGGGHYTVYIDKGITTEAKLPVFEEFLENGEACFDSLEDMTEFFRSLQALYAERESPEPLVIDREKVRRLRKEKDPPAVIWPEQISGPLKERIFGQDKAIDALADAVAINRMRKEDKLLVLAMLGPTATGKSATARMLADILTRASGTEYGYIEVAGNEFVSEHMVSRFLGAPAGYVGYGNKTVLDPVRSNPCHVIVINEIEKSNDKLLTALMEAMETGYLGMADNSPSIDLRKCILIFTSNLPVDMDSYEKMSAFEGEEYCKDIFTKYCGKPEISRRISSFLVYRSLSEDAETDILIASAAEAVESFGGRLCSIEEYLIADLLRSRTVYGAGEIKNRVGTVIGKSILRSRQTDFISGKNISLGGTAEQIELTVLP